MSGLFASWQPEYEAAGIATFPVRGKVPAVKHYLRAGRNASRQFASKFPDANAFGFACHSANIAVLDIDSPSDNLLADALAEFGPSPIIIRSGSGNHQVWYRRRGQGRRIRPDKSRPIDILGRGYVVAPPSVGAKGSYQFITGSLNDLASLPSMLLACLPAAAEPHTDTLVASAGGIAEGSRNDTLWRHCMAKAKQCSSLDVLLLQAQQFNAASCSPPLSGSEVVACAASAWRVTAKGDNWFGTGGLMALPNETVRKLVTTEADAFLLLSYLKAHHWGRNFAIANAMHKDFGWSRVCAIGPGKSAQFGTKSKAGHQKAARFKGYSQPRGSMPSIEWVHVTELQVDQTYQRSIENQASARLINSIAHNFDWRLCAPLVVSRRSDGSKVIIDGQHRWAAAMKRGDLLQLPCCLFVYASAQDEARMFIVANRARKPMNRLDDFHAAVAAADEDALEIQRLVHSAGLTIARSISSNHWLPGDVAFTSSIANALRQRGDVPVGRILRMIAKAFDGEVLTQGASIFRGTAMVYAKAERAIQDHEISAALRSRTMLEWTATVRPHDGGEDRASAVCDALMANMAQLAEAA